MDKRKLIAPIVIIGILLIYIFFWCFVFWSIIEIPFGLKLALLVAPLLMAGVGVYVLIERIKEIRSGEEDDLSKY